MKSIPLKASQIRLWIVEDAGYPHIHRIYVPHVVIWRVIEEHDYCRLILRGRFFLIGKEEEPYRLRHFKPGSYIEVHAGDIADPSEYDPSAMIMEFRDCGIRRKWITDLGILSSMNRLVEEWLEVESRRWKYK